MTNTLNKIIHNGDEYMLPRQKALVITLTSAGWTNNEQTVTATGVTANNSIIISPVPTYISDYTDAKISCSAQGTDSLTFTCDTTPSNDIEVNVLVLSAEVGSTPTPPSPWQPGVNTMLYLPMDTDLLDHSGNSLTVNNLGSVSLVSTGTGASVPVAQFNSTSTELTFAYQGSINSAWTMSFWENTINQNTNAQFITAGTWSRHNLFQIGYTDSSSRGLTLSNYGEDINLGSYAGRDSSWHLITATYSGTAGQTNNAKVYMDGSLVMQGTMQGWNWNNNTFMIGNYNQETAMGGYLSKFIVETAERTAQEVSDYFNQTKGNYGIS